MEFHSLNDLPIGMFDSGIGGLTVMRQIMKKNPKEDIIYFGDTARIPYGDKNSKTIERYAIENTLLLLSRNIKLLVIACNTASAHATALLRKYFNIPIIDVIESVITEIASAQMHHRIAILATSGTVNSSVYEKRLLQKLPKAEIFSIPCPLFTPLIEEGFTHHAATREIVKEYLAPLKEKAIDTLLLGCTHYPLLLHLIKEECGPSVHIIDPAEACASHVAATLQKKASKRSVHILPKPTRFTYQTIRTNLTVSPKAF